MLRWFAYVLTVFGVVAGGLWLMLLIARKDAADIRGALLGIFLIGLIVGLALLFFMGEYPFAA